MSDTVTVRPFEEQDLAPTLETLRLALGETPLLERTPEWFGWKHFENPFGRSLLVVAEANGRIAGLRAFMRWELSTPDGGTLRCVRAVDTATHPDYVRRGVFRKLTLEALDLARADGVDLVFNTPNQKSGAGYLKMGWSEVGRIGVMVHPTWRMALRNGLAEGTEPSLLSADDGPAVQLDVEDRSPMALRTPRTPEYLAWRFGGHPTARYRRLDASGSTAVLRPNLRNGRAELVVSDVFGPSPHRAIGAARRRSRAAYLIGGFSSGSPERKAAIRAGMVPIPGVTGFNLFANPLVDLPVDVTTLTNWDLAVSDLELL